MANSKKQSIQYADKCVLKIISATTYKHIKRYEKNFFLFFNKQNNDHKTLRDVSILNFLRKDEQKVNKKE